MKHATKKPVVLDAPGRGRATGKAFAHLAFVAGAFGFFVYAIAATSDVELATASVDQTATAPAASITQTASAPVEKATPRGALAGKGQLAYRQLAAHSPLLDPTYSLGPTPTSLGQSVRVPSQLELALADPRPYPAQSGRADPDIVAALPSANSMPLPPTRPEPAATVANVPLPLARPAEAKMADAKSGPTRQEIAEPNKAVALATPAPGEKESIFQKLFGTPWKGPTLAYAAPDGGIFSDGSSQTPGKYDQYTAVYDISARTVYLPDGRKLEAHSGLGNRLDDPRFVHERMRGATPPHVYDLAMRERPFHGVRAIRLKPVGGEAAVFGRTGLLAHTFMLGPNGDSNGCVSFRDYNAFLRAYESGQIKRLAVVAKLS